MLSFIYNGVSSKDIGIMVNKISHHDILSAERIEKGSFPRMNGIVYNNSDTFESYNLDVECTLFNTFTIETISKIKDLFKNRDGELIISNKPNHILKVKLISTIPFSKLFANTGSFLLTFEVNPMSYLKSGQTWITVSNGSKIVNIGNHTSNPLYRITGSDKCILNINDQKITFENVKNTFTVDTELEDVYGANGENFNNYMTIESDFVGLKVGENTISYSGISKLEILPRWVDQ